MTGDRPGPGAARDRGGPGEVDAPDEVDRVVAAWARVRPDLDVAPLEVLSRVSRLAHHLDRARASTFDAHGLERWEFDVLAALRRSGPPHRLTPSQLLPQTLVTSGTMTTRIDRLAARGLVSRGSSPRDRRLVVVELTEDGRELVDAAMASLLEREASFLAGMPRRDRERLADLLRVLVRPFER
ncbi:MarR family winged helix-turn-helix transcriptional regulator [Aquipuribacter sp. SD81]|uniref:MarR family winged helix-turn-helix transcriptional regulator n=1 Tax=Aquipuribacter sp. SD81 TaxID=3127703 RepID=UPI003018D7A0